MLQGFHESHPHLSWISKINFLAFSSYELFRSSSLDPSSAEFSLYRLVYALYLLSKLVLWFLCRNGSWMSPFILLCGLAHQGGFAHQARHLVLFHYLAWSKFAINIFLESLHFFPYITPTDPTFLSYNSVNHNQSNFPYLEPTFINSQTFLKWLHGFVSSLHISGSFHDCLTITQTHSKVFQVFTEHLIISQNSAY